MKTENIRKVLELCNEQLHTVDINLSKIVEPSWPNSILKNHLSVLLNFSVLLILKAIKFQCGL